MSSKIVFLSLVLWICALVAAASKADEAGWIQDREDATRRLRAAAVAGWTKTANEAIRYGAEIDETDEYGTTALILAAIHGHERIVQALLDAGANPNRENDDHVGPLLAASANCNDPVVTLLLKYGANPNPRSQTRQTPLMRAAENGCHVVVKELLKAKGIDLQLADDTGRTAADYARESANLELDWGESWAEIESMPRGPSARMTPARASAPMRRTLPRGTDGPRPPPRAPTRKVL